MVVNHPGAVVVVPSPATYPATAPISALDRVPEKPGVPAAPEVTAAAICAELRPRPSRLPPAAPWQDEQKDE